ncbi:MAG: hypothetical protein AAGC74_08880 [Verrucomicrobiota bacterium]
MKKVTLGRLLWLAPTLVVFFLVALSFFGRGVGSHPLPWNVAWMCCFGDDGWERAWEFSLRKGMTKDEGTRAVGAGEVTQGEEGQEFWYYVKPHADSEGRAIRFEGELVAEF